MRKNNYNTHIYKSKDFQILCKERYDLKILKKGDFNWFKLSKFTIVILDFSTTMGNIKKRSFH